MHNDAQSEPVGAQSEPQSESVGVGIFFGCKTLAFSLALSLSL